MLGAAVLAAALGLYLVLQTEGDGATERTASGAASPPSAPRIAQTAPGKPRIALAVRPEPVTEYRTGQTRVRDHRTGEHTPIELSPPPHRRNGREISSHITSDLAQRLRPLVRQCTASVPAEARGAKPRVEGEILIAIKDHQATVTAATLQLLDVAEAAQGEVKRCLTQSAVGLVAPADDESDLESYPITLSLRLP